MKATYKGREIIEIKTAGGLTFYKDMIDPAELKIDKPKGIKKAPKTEK